MAVHMGGFGGSFEKKDEKGIKDEKGMFPKRIIAKDDNDLRPFPLPDWMKNLKERVYFGSASGVKEELKNLEHSVENQWNIYKKQGVTIAYATVLDTMILFFAKINFSNPEKIIEDYFEEPKYTKV